MALSRCYFTYVNDVSDIVFNFLEVLGEKFHKKEIQNGKCV